MSDRDPFTEARDDTEHLREALDDVRRDVEAVVREEVRRSAVSRATLEEWIRDAVRRELAASGPGRPWTRAALGVVAAVALLALGALGYRALAGGRPAAGPEAVEAESGAVAPGVGSEVAPGEGAGAAPTAETPEERLARLDSLFDARSSRFDPLLARLEAAGPPPAVHDALAAWRAGRPLDPSQERRLRDALLQLTLNELTGERLVLDGLVTRGPCGGSSCGVLLRLWEGRGAELGLPPYPPDAASDLQALRTAEGMLLLARLEEGPR